MNANTPLERTIVTWMADEAGGHVPDALVDDILRITGRERPQPRWFALLKEPPMRLHSRVAVGSPSRRIGLAAVLALLLLAATALVVGALVNRTPTTTSDDWPGFRGDAARSGNAARGPVGLPVLQWRFRAAGPVNSDVAIVGDAVFVASDDGIVRALDRTSGAERWAFRTAQGPLIGLAIDSGLALVVDGTGHLIALDAATGKERWASRSALIGPSNLAVDGGRVYAGQSDGSIAAINAASGVEMWRTSISTVGPANSPAVADGMVFDAGTGAGISALDAATGNVVWHAETGPDQLGTPVVSGGIAYIGASGQAASGRLWAFDEKTGRPLWVVDQDLQAPSVANGVAFTASSSGLIAALDSASGTTRWTFHVQGPAHAPAVAAGVVYVAADGEHRVYALDAASGGYLWRFDVDGSNGCCIAVARGAVVLGTNSGSVYAIGGDGSRPVVAAPPSDVAVASSSASSAPSPVVPSASATSPGGSPVPAVVSPIWQSSGSDGALVPNRITRDPSGRLWVSDAAANRFAIFKPDGTFLEYWGTAGSGDGQLNLHRTNGDSYGSIAFAPDGSFVVLDVGNERVQVFDAKRQFVRAWGGYGSGPGRYTDPVDIAVGPDGLVHVLDDVRGVIETYDRSGTVRGSFDAFVNAGHGANTANAMALDAAGNFYVSDINPAQVERYDPAGKLTMTYGSPGVAPGQFSEQPGGMAIDAAGRLFVGQGPDRAANAPAVLVFNPEGSYLVGFGTTEPGDLELRWPAGMLFEGDGTVVIGDDASVFDQTMSSELKAFKLIGPLAPISP
jgi:outer membrane protein assembly factor BamB